MSPVTSISPSTGSPPSAAVNQPVNVWPVRVGSAMLPTFVPYSTTAEPSPSPPFNESVAV